MFMHLSSSILLRAEAQATWTGRGAEWVLAWTATPAFATVALVPQQDWPARAALPTAGTDLLDATLLCILLVVVGVVFPRGRQSYRVCVCLMPLPSSWHKEDLSVILPKPAGPSHKT